jgi:hypothetical protein
LPAKQAPGGCYAIEAGHAVEIAREMIRQNDVEDRALWNFGFGEGMLGFVRDASERILRDGGRIVPAAIEAWLAPVEMPKLYERLDRWPKDYEVDMSVMRSLAMNYVHQVDLDRDALLAEPKLFAGVDMHEFQEDDCGTS